MHLQNRFWLNTSSVSDATSSALNNIRNLDVINSQTFIDLSLEEKKLLEELATKLKNGENIDLKDVSSRAQTFISRYDT